MQIIVYLPPYLKSSHADERGFVTIEEGATLKDLFELLGVPFPLGTVHLCRVNYEKAKLNRTLNERDMVSFFSLISGE